MGELKADDRQEPWISGLKDGDTGHVCVGVENGFYSCQAVDFVTFVAKILVLNCANSD